ncbi:MAG TPA: ABC transporter substrate-binding protein [Acidobacteriaceae bacterium]|nr:ABC transporter substrate-binding protein [Acidobacteriaceae bacterium]
MGWKSIVVAVCLGTLLGCNDRNPPAGRQHTDTLSTHLDTRPPQHVVINEAFEHLLYIGLYVASDAGFFAREGLDVTINTGGGDAQAFSALSSGAADFAQGDPAFVAIAHERGWDGRVVAMAVNRVAIWGITKDSTIKPFTDPRGFRGRRVSTYPRPNTSFVVQEALVRRAGLRIGQDTRIVEVPFGTEIAALERGDVDIAQTIEPNVTQFEVKGGHVVFSYPDAWGPLAFTGVMVSERTIRERPDMVRRFVHAYSAAYGFLREHPDSATVIAASHLKSLDHATIRRALQRLIDSQSLPPSVEVDSASWRKLLEARVQVGDLRRMPNVPLYDNQFIR